MCFRMASAFGEKHIRQKTRSILADHPLTQQDRTGVFQDGG